ncbi:MAG TPA: DUF1549 domain-containing protein, partial [Verrucomicrobiae bacterium]|nr:DUF1549 domain-containing protein [Verrucomicrobiae bacterium]
QRVVGFCLLQSYVLFPMKPVFVLALALTGSLFTLPAWAKMTPGQLAQLPPPTARPIDFSKDIKPILENSCMKCHGRGQSKGDFRIDTRETILQSAESGPAIVPGKSAESHFIELVMGFDPDSVMPKKGSRLKPEQISLLRAWIDQGLPWDKDVSFGKLPHLNLAPRTVAVPVAAKGSGLTNPIDLLLQEYFRTNKFSPPAPVDDRRFARRVYLDTVGLLPAPEELEKFAADKGKDKREQLVKRLLHRNQDYAQHWLTFWNDLLRNDYRGTGYIDGGRKQITTWLYSALADNLPYNEFVGQLLNPTPACDGFTKGIVWRGTVNASQVPPMQAAQNISQVFMGVNLKCASCHDSFINDYTLADAYGLANIYADQQMELFRCDKPTGKMAETRFIYPELGSVMTNSDRSARLKQLAGVITAKSDGRLTRTIVNRLWERFYGRGLVEPVDEMDSPAWHQDLLDWLAEDLAGHGYDLKHTITLMLTARAYQLPAVNLGEQAGKGFVFQGPAVRRMSAEQFRDALGSLTGIGYQKPDAKVDWASGVPAAERAAAMPLAAKWIWNDPKAAEKAKAEHVYFRKVITLSAEPTEAKMAIVADNSFTLYVNGEKAGTGKEYNRPETIDLKGRLRKGENTVAIMAVNFLPDNTEHTPEKAVAGTENAAGLIFYAQVRAKKRVMDFASDGSWTWSAKKVDGWEKPGFMREGWTRASELGDADMWEMRNKLVAVFVGAPPVKGMVRASLVAADPLAVALGRPNREQVVTVRASSATTLQGLELTNGSTLSEVLKQGAKKILTEAKASGRDVPTELYLKALGRKPTGAETKLATDMIGHGSGSEGVEDLVWAMAMLPEFQLIY